MLCINLTEHKLKLESLPLNRRLRIWHFAYPYHKIGENFFFSFSPLFFNWNLQPIFANCPHVGRLCYGAYRPRDLPRCNTVLWILQRYLHFYQNMQCRELKWAESIALPCRFLSWTHLLCTLCQQNREILLLLTGNLTIFPFCANRCAVRMSEWLKSSCRVKGRCFADCDGGHRF